MPCFDAGLLSHHLLLIIYYYEYNSYSKLAMAAFEY